MSDGLKEAFSTIVITVCLVLHVTILNPSHQPLDFVELLDIRECVADLVALDSPVCPAVQDTADGLIF